MHLFHSNLVRLTYWCYLYNYMAVCRSKKKNYMAHWKHHSGTWLFLVSFCFPFISCWFGFWCLYLNVLYEWFFLLISHTRTGLYSLQSTSSSSNKKNVLTEIRIKQQEIMSIIKLQLSIHNKPLDYPKPFSWWTNQPNNTLICYRKERNNDQTTSI